MRLCLAFGEPDPVALKRRMPSSLWSRWLAYAELEPWGFEVENLRAASIAATVANYAGKVLPQGQKVSAKDFALRVERPLSLVDRIKKAFGVP